MPRGEISYEDMHKLIELVRRNPVLYDPTNKDYKDTSHIENCWNRIAKQMGRSDMSGYEWRKKWVNRRDTYVKKKRHIRNHHSPMAVERAKRWRFFDAMSFLDRFFEGSNYSMASSIEYNAANEDDSSEAAMSGDEDPDESANGFHLKSESAKRPAHSLSPSATSSKRKAPDPDSSNGNTVFSVMPIPSSITFNGTDEIQGSSFVNSMTDQIDTHLNDHYHNSQPSTSTRVACPDYHLLFQSYAHRLERLPERTQSFIQLQIAQLFFNAENPDLLPMAIIPLPSPSTLTSSSSSSSSSFRQQARRQDDVRDQRQQPQQQRSMRSENADANAGLEIENAGVPKNTIVKVEEP